MRLKFTKLRNLATLGGGCAHRKKRTDERNSCQSFFLQPDSFITRAQEVSGPTGIKLLINFRH